MHLVRVGLVCDVQAVSLGAKWTRAEDSRDSSYKLDGTFRRVYWILKLTVDCSYKLHGDFSKYILKLEDNRDRGYRLHGSFRRVY